MWALPSHGHQRSDEQCVHCAGQGRFMRHRDSASTQPAHDEEHSAKSFLCIHLQFYRGAGRGWYTLSMARTFIESHDCKRGNEHAFSVCDIERATLCATIRFEAGVSFPMDKTLIIDYYTDILCVWAWIAQRRIDELNKKLGNSIKLHYHYIDIFGDVPAKMNTQWQSKGGYVGFAEHVQKSASVFEDALINPKIWTEVRPNTSANAHLMLKAVEITYDKNKSIDMALQFRTAFFVDALDIGNLDVLCDLVKANGLDRNTINTSIRDGSAMAFLMGDYQNAKRQEIKGSPSYVIGDGRQTLYGNVGYRVILANIEELLKNPTDEASWC
jgi:predicted DsbA family dithiol-disulfide isomerase